MSEQGEPLDALDRILTRAAAGEDVSEALIDLAPETRAELETVLAGQRLILGLAAPIPSVPIQSTLGSELLAGRYQVLSELSRGGMGVVYLGQDTLRGQRVVIKVMALDKAWNPRMRARFERETRALRKIPRHPNVVHVVDAGEDPTQGPYLVMELVEGRNLQAAIQQHSRIEPRRAALIARDVARGLAVVHRHGLIHRDVKPANVMLSPGGRAKLVDFGLAKDSFLTTITKAGQILGTCFYMAPEQWDEEQREDSRCDVFALGATLYHMLVGAPPFVGDDLGEIMEECLCGEYEPAEALVEGLFGDLPLVLHQMLATDRRFRYARMDDVADDLERILKGEPCRVPCLVGGQGDRHLLYPGQRWSIGRDDGCRITIADPTVSRQHAEVRREAGGYVLRDLGSSYGTCVGGRRVEQPHTLCGGDAVDVGDVRLTFLDPHNQPDESPRTEVAGALTPDPVARLLVELADPRTVLTLIEQLAPDPERERAVCEAVEGLFGRSAREAVALVFERRSVRTHADLTAVTGEIDPGGLEGWLAWWDHARYELPPQVGRARPRVQERLRAPDGRTLELEDRETVLLGRDPRCHLTFESPRVSRLHATLFRLHARWVVRDEGSSSGTRLNDVAVRYAVLSPGATLRLGDVELAFESAPSEVLPAIRPGLHLLDPSAFEALLGLRHPATAAALVGFLTEDLGWIGEQAQALYPGDPDRQRAFGQRLEAVYRERRQLAREALPSLLGGSPGDDPSAWTARLHARAATLPSQVLPRGWLAVTRS